VPGPDVIELEVFYDYLCPFVYRASVLLQNVSESGERKLKVGWRYFSLSQVNSKDEGWTVWDAPASDRVRGRLAFKAAEAARRQGRFEDVHMPLLRARHRDRLDIDQVAVVEQVAVEAGLDLEQFRRDIAAEDILDSLARDHRAAVAEHGVFGTPTFVFEGGNSAYVRLSEAPDAGEATRVFDRLLSIAANEPGILEIKRPVRPSRD
jgi:predicted DsbA family dithiol-disulfide isomerase